ncbi:MAG: hypothetical protein NWR72_09905 [Bacteroidia bacterium]|nr:hypothetical protein [Bacteroidia bacterium]
MQQRKAWKYLSLLSHSEQTDWLKHLALTFGEKQQVLHIVARLLVKEFPRAPELEEVWQALYPGDAYDDARLRKILADLTTQLEHYLGNQSFQSSPLDQRLHLLQRLIYQPDADLFGQAWRKTCKDLYRLAESAKDMARYRYEIEVLNREYRIRHRLPEGNFGVLPQEKWWPTAGTLQRIVELNTAHHLFSQLELMISIESFSKRSDTRVDTPLAHEFLNLARSHPFFSRLPLIAFYLRIIDMLRGSASVRVDVLTRFFLRSHARLPKFERGQLFGILLNHLIASLNKKESKEIILDLLDLYEKGMELQLLQTDGVLLPAHYRNFVALCLRNHSTERAKKFMEASHKFLPEDARKELPALNNIYISFAEKNYPETIRLVNRITFSRPIDEIDARAVLIQAHYESGQQDLEWLENQLNRLIRYTRMRPELSKQHKNSYIRRFRMYGRLIRAHQPEEFDRLYEYVIHSGNLDKGSWVKEKIEEKRAAL